MTKKRLWLAAPVLALSLFASMASEVEASTGVPATPPLATVTEGERTVLSATATKVKSFDEAKKLIAEDLAKTNASTTFTIEYNGSEKFGDKLGQVFTEASWENEYVYGSGAGYAPSIAYAGNTYTVTLYYNYH